MTENKGKKGVAQKTIFSTSDRLGKTFGVSGDLLGHNARGIALLTLMSLKNPRLTGLIFTTYYQVQLLVFTII